MKLHLTLLGMAGLLLGLGAGAAPQPRLVCDQPVFDFGERESSGELEHEFVIRNAGDIALQINNLRPTCGCLVPKFTDRIIAPGRTASITAAGRASKPSSCISNPMIRTSPPMRCI